MTARSVEAILEYLSDGGTPSNLDRADIEALVNRINRLQSHARAAEEGAAAGMTAIDDRATALILRDQVKHLENALREAGNLARALERRLAESDERRAAAVATVTENIATWLERTGEHGFAQLAAQLRRGEWP